MERVNNNNNNNRGSSNNNGGSNRSSKVSEKLLKNFNPLSSCLPLPCPSPSLRCCCCLFWIFIKCIYSCSSLASFFLHLFFVFWRVFSTFFLAGCRCGLPL